MKETRYGASTPILVRYGEIGIQKRQSQEADIERTLVNNIERTLGFCAISYEAVFRDFGRIFVKTRDSSAAQAVASVLELFQQVLSKTSAATLDAMKSAAVRIVSPLLTNGKSLAFEHVERERTTTQANIGEVVGGAIEKATGAPVRLSKPDVPLFIEVRASNAYLYTEVVPGVGGLPMGTQGKVIALVSGGIAPRSRHGL